jgi:hypothetical protein
MARPKGRSRNLQRDITKQEEPKLAHRADDAIALDWLKEFERSNGRPLRVLHIGNIANNAYNNAKIQRSCGIEADVLCYDYYHVMGTPEWEDGGLTTTVDPQFPDWWATNLGGFKRPDWFVQGPAAICIKYLSARANRQKFRRAIWRWVLEGEYWCLVEDRAWQTGLRRQVSRYREGIGARLYSMLMHSATYIGLLDPFDSIRQRLIRSKSILRQRVIVPIIIAGRTSPTFRRVAMLAAILLRFGIRNTDVKSNRLAWVDDEDRKAIRSNFSTAWILVSFALAAAHASLAAVVHVITSPARAFSYSKHSKVCQAELLLKFRQQEPNVSEELWRQLSNYLQHHTRRFGPALESYDIIQGYSIDGIIPLSLGNSNFCCYEHGTLRNIPFEDTLTGLICRLAYKNAPGVFITNSDVMGSVHQLRLDERKVCCLPHAFDDLKLDRFRMSNPSIVPDSTLVHFFCPSRQHWRDQDPSLTKGSDLMLRAAAEVAAEGHKFRLTLVEWGVDIEASKQLIRELGLEQFVSWVSPMGKSALWGQYCSSHAVMDQFSLAALGGVGFETLALGRRLITKIDARQLEFFFGQAPPVLPATNQLEIFNSMRSVVLDPVDATQIGEAGRQWIKDYHSARRIVALQARAYRSLLAKQGLNGGNRGWR